MCSRLLTSIFSIDEGVLTAVANSDDLNDHMLRLQELEAEIRELRRRNQLPEAIARAAGSMAHRVRAIVELLTETRREDDLAVDCLQDRLATVLNLGERAKRGSSHMHHQNAAPKRVRRVETSDAPFARSNKNEQPDRSSTLRDWFLRHLSSPYPSADQKSALAAAVSCSRNKIESDLTNWRRRCGWTEMMHTFAGGKRELMAPLVERIECILNDRDADDFNPQMEQRRIRKVATECGLSVKDMDEAVKAVEKMKKYLTREEEERVGDWVHEIANLTGKKSLQAYVKPPARGASTSIRARRRESTQDEEDAGVDIAHHDVAVADADHNQDVAQGDSAADPQDRTISNQTSMSSLGAASNAAPGQLRNVSGSSGFSVATGSEASFDLGSMSPEVPLRSRAVDRFRARSGRANGNARSSSTATPTSGTFSFVPVIAPRFTASPVAVTPPVRDELVTLPVKRDSSEEGEEEDNHSDRSDHRKMPLLDDATSRASRASFSSQSIFAEEPLGVFDYTERYRFGPASNHGSHHSVYHAPPLPLVPEPIQYHQHGYQQQVIYYDPRHPPIMRALPSMDTPQPVHFSSAASRHSSTSDFGSQGPWNQYPTLPMLPHMQMQPPTQPAISLPEQWEFRPYHPQDAHR